MLARIIIFEGPDGVGKTTLINHIRKEFNDSYYMHLRVHKDMKLWHTASARLAIKKKHEGKLVLIDRHWPSEQCYSYIYREGPSYDPTEIVKKLRQEGALYVWCLPEDINRVKENLKSKEWFLAKEMLYEVKNQTSLNNTLLKYQEIDKFYV